MTHRESGNSSASTQGSSWKNRLGGWTVYAAAASAALAAATSAEADIVYSGPVDLTITFPLLKNGHLVSRKAISIDGGFAGLHVQETRLTYNGAVFGQGAEAIFLLFSSVKGQFLRFATVGRNSVAKDYSKSEPILLRHAHSLGVLSSQAHFGSTFGTVYRGQFRPPVDGFVGFSNSATNTKGWIQVEVLDRNQDNYLDQVEIIDYAYNNTTGGAIDAGQTSSSTVPEPCTLSLALLGAGVTALMAWRRRTSTDRSDKQT